MPIARSANGAPMAPVVLPSQVAPQHTMFAAVSAVIPHACAFPHAMVSSRCADDGANNLLPQHAATPSASSTHASVSPMHTATYGVDEDGGAPWTPYCALPPQHVTLPPEIPHV